MDHGAVAVLFSSSSRRVSLPMGESKQNEHAPTQQRSGAPAMGAAMEAPPAGTEACLDPLAEPEACLDSLGGGAGVFLPERPGRGRVAAKIVAQESVSCVESQRELDMDLKEVHREGGDTTRSRRPGGKPQEGGQGPAAGMPRPPSPSVGPAFHCFRCNQLGHRAAECPAPNPRSPGVSSGATPPKKSLERSRAAKQQPSPVVQRGSPAAAETTAMARYRLVDDEDSPDDASADPMLETVASGLSPSHVLKIERFWPPQPNAGEPTMDHGEVAVPFSSSSHRASLPMGESKQNEHVSTQRRSGAPAMGAAMEASPVGTEACLDPLAEPEACLDSLGGGAGVFLPERPGRGRVAAEIIAQESLDTKKSPLALLMQTCSQIGKPDPSPSSKLITVMSSGSSNKEASKENARARQPGDPTRPNEVETGVANRVTRHAGSSSGGEEAGGSNA
ncbi:zinc finger protein [Crotalus adamanteus]|uniref:Zinc finger protein n=1 Tax=Crotalus adamanteus TaxID=8729 RepID=A0AAW1B0P6_CROAD